MEQGLSENKVKMKTVEKCDPFFLQGEKQANMFETHCIHKERLCLMQLKAMGPILVDIFQHKTYILKEKPMKTKRSHALVCKIFLFPLTAAIPGKTRIESPPK